MYTGVDLSEILDGTKILGESVTITEEIIGVSQLLGARTRAAPSKV